MNFQTPSIALGLPPMMTPLPTLSAPVFNILVPSLPVLNGPILNGPIIGAPAGLACGAPAGIGCGRNWAPATASAHKPPVATLQKILPKFTSTDREKLGAGVGGQVYRCKIDGKPRIVKSMIDPKQQLMFDKEVAAFKALKPHANICAPLQVGIVDGKQSMIFASGTVPSSTVAERAAALPPNDQLAVLEVCVRDLLGGLKFLHDNGYVHGDIKLANSVCDPTTGRFKLIDLGHATVASANDKRTGKQVLQHRSGRSGDPGYTSPELEHPELGNKALDASSTLQSVDVYAVGRIMEDALERADERFERVHGGKPTAAMAAGDPEVARWMKRRERIGKVAGQMLLKDAGARPLVQAALDALTPPASERLEGRKVLAQLMAAKK